MKSIFLFLAMGLLSCASNTTTTVTTEIPEEILLSSTEVPEGLEIEGTVLVKYTGSAKTLVIPESLGITEIGKNAFRDSSVQRVFLPPGLKVIGEYAFGNCKDLFQIKIPGSVTEIRNHAFWACSGLSSVEIPEGVHKIGFQAFGYCRFIKIDIPASVLSISDYVFGRCNNLLEINVHQDNINYCGIDGVLFNKEATILVQYPPGKANGSYKIPETVRVVNDWAFDNNRYLNVIEISANVSRLDGNYTFSSMDLAKFVVDERNSHFSARDDVLYNKDQTILLSYPDARGTRYAVPDGVEQIAPFAFYFRGKLREITFPDSLLVIGRYAFTHCRGMDGRAIVLPPGLSNIGISAFNDIENLNVKVSRNTQLSENAFYGNAKIEYID